MGEAFGGFELVGRLGAGGMAEAWSAVRRGPGGFEQRVCVKRILPSWKDDARFVRMFLEEARIAARLRHGTIVQVIEAGDDGGVPYLALELVEGADLRKLIDATRAKRTRLAAEQVALVALDLATALEVAHREGVLHRDVSPANVLLSASGEVKLSDFGIAKAADSARHTRTGIAKGKPSYMSPEYASTGKATVQSDLYALGVTLYEVATGVRPFRAATELASQLKARSGERKAVAVLAPELPWSLAWAIDRLIEPDPAHRFASAEELFDALSDVTPVPGARRRLGRAVRELVSGVEETTQPCEPPPPDDTTRDCRAR
jgi:serine/threonine protein kinase